tara:strand:- start:5368 stop:5739 length:372 start_codon:yes stop_codon:yes gene_type:complete
MVPWLHGNKEPWKRTNHISKRAQQMAQHVEFKTPARPRTITPKNPAKSAFIIHEQVGYIVDETTGELQDATFRVEKPEGYSLGVYDIEQPRLRRGDFNAATWDRDIELVKRAGEASKPRAVNG